MTTSTIAVTGATGFVGRHLVRNALERGHTVRALVRSLDKARQVLPVHDRLVYTVGNIFNESVLGDLVRGADACVHLVGIIRQDGSQTFKRMHVEATERVVAACQGAGVSRYLHMSALGADPEGKAEYQKTKFEAELRVSASELDWTIFRPSLIHGPDGEFIAMMHSLVSGQMAPWFFLPYFVREERYAHSDKVLLGASHFVDPKVQPILVDDVADAFLNAVNDTGSFGEIYNLVGSEVISWPDMLEFLRDALPGGQHGLHAWHIPGVHAAAIAKVAGAVGLGGLLPFDAGQAYMGMHDSTASLTKVRSHLGLAPRGFRESVSAYAPAMHDPAH